MTLIVAHRGASAYEIENSLSAFRLAHTMGADGIELDVHVTADGVPVVHHDPLIDERPIWQLTRAAMAEHVLPNGEAVPTLAEALAAIDPGLFVFVEVKALVPRDDQHLLAVLAAGPAPDRYHVHAFDHRIVCRLREQRGDLPTGVLSTSYPIRPVAQLEDAWADTLWQEESLVDAELISLVHEAGTRLFAWTVDDPARMRVLASLGADAICTNRPDIARATLGGPASQ
jgi:glycerophosphoryl diester phosphodiesterase